MPSHDRRRGSEYHRLVVDASPDAVSTDAFGVVTAWNARAVTLFGWTAEEAAGADRLSSAFALPIVAAAGMEGVLEFCTRQSIAPDRSLLEVLASLGSQIGQFIDLVLELSWEADAGRRRRFGAARTAAATTRTATNCRCPGWITLERGEKVMENWSGRW